MKRNVKIFVEIIIEGTGERERESTCFRFIAGYSRIVIGVPTNSTTIAILPILKSISSQVHW